MSNHEAMRGELERPSAPLSPGGTESAKASSDGERSLLALVALYALGVALLCRGLDRDAIELGLRLQARLSFVLYLLALAGPGLQVRSANTWLARNQESLYRAFALSHLIHGAGLVLYYLRTSAVFTWNISNVSGLLAFPLIAVLLLPRSRRIGRRWARIQLGVVAYVWLQFAGFFVDRLDSGRPELMPWYLVAIALSVAAAWLGWRGRGKLG